MVNVFNEPQKYIDEIKNVRIPEDIMEEKKAEHSGKTMLCSWVTKLCPAKCSACFFKSNMYKGDSVKEKYELSDVGVNNLIKFINESNNSYLMLSGGGEPMIRPKVINKIVKEAKTDRIVIVTSGIWANTKQSAEKYIDELYESTMSRNDDCVVVLRLSIDDFHYSSPSINYEHYKNIIDVFREKYKDNKNFILRIHTMQNDPTLENVINDMGGEVVYEKMNGVTDNDNVIKIVPNKATIKFPDGYNIFVGLSKLFLANIKTDITKMNPDIKKALEVFEKDMKVSEYGNPSIITNCNGLQGLDLWSDYNGNITAWGCQQPDDLHSIYTNSYDDIVNKTYNNIGSYSFLDKGYYYRRNIIRDVNPRAVLRSEVINLRDYAGAFLIEEDDTRLYYDIRAIQDYLKEKVLSEDDIQFLSPELQALIYSKQEEVDKYYNNSNYDILYQYLINADRYTKEDWEDLFTLINLGHYDVKENTKKYALNYYNNKYNEHLSDISDAVDSNDDAQLARLHNRISPMQSEAYNEFLCDDNKCLIKK